MCIYREIYMYVCMCVYIYIYAHTYLSMYLKLDQNEILENISLDRTDYSQNKVTH